jgi:hypothetical protein
VLNKLKKNEDVIKLLEEVDQVGANAVAFSHFQEAVSQLSLPKYLF